MIHNQVAVAEDSRFKSVFADGVAMNDAILGDRVSAAGAITKVDSAAREVRRIFRDGAIRQRQRKAAAADCSTGIPCEILREQGIDDFRAAVDLRSADEDRASASRAVSIRT